MDLDRLKTLLPDVPKLEVHWNRFQRESGTTDTSEFVADLHVRGLVNDAQLRDVLTSGDVAFTLSEADRSGPAEATRYRVLGLLGKGAMGEVHIARDHDLHRNVAIKRINPALMGRAALTRRFYTEIQVSAQLDHPGIVPVYSLETAEDGALGYAMKLIRGKTLKDVVEEARAAHDAGRALGEDHDLPARLDLFLQVCNAMHYAHSRGVLHRDLKPENIMVGPFHEVTVMDWGIARILGTAETPFEAAPGEDVALEGTQLGMAVGTPPYMSPEQAQGRNDDLTPASDQYALGLILFELVSLKRALTGKTAVQILHRAAGAEKDRLVHYKGERIPRELAAIIAKATAYEPRARYADVESLADDVRRFLRDEAVIARPDTGTQRITRWISRHRDATLAMVLGLMLLVFAVGATAIVGGGAVVIAQREAARWREERLTEVVGAVSGQAHRIDSEFRRYESLLSGLAAAAELVLVDDPAATPPGAEPRRIFLGPDYRAGRGPPDLIPSKVYGGPVSLDYPDNELANGVEPKAVERQLRQLAALQPMMRRMLLRSESDAAVKLDPDAQRALIADQGVPMVWAYVATEQGVITGMPGKGDYPDDYDPRDRSWYTSAVARGAIGWTAADWDESGAGLLMPCNAPLYAADGSLLGVAALDVSIGYVIDELLDPPALSAPVEAWLVDANGLVVVQSSLLQQLKEPQEGGPADRVLPPLPYPEVVEALRGGVSSGRQELVRDGRTELVVWSRLDSVDWTYVVTGDARALLAQ